MNEDVNRPDMDEDDKFEFKMNEIYSPVKKRKYAKSPLTPVFSPTEGEDKKPNDELPTPSSSLDQFGLNSNRQEDGKHLPMDPSSSTPDSPSHRLMHQHLNQHPFFNQSYHFLNNPGLMNQAASVSSTSIPKFPQGPQPITPPPPAPQISAAELSLLTDVTANKNGTFQCTLCHKQFGYKNGLIRHVRLTHVGEKPYQCNICNRRFGYKHILMEHQNLHFGNRPYACVQCDKRFAARSNLIQHRTVHKRPYNCTLCNKRFDREDQLKKHLFAHPQSLLACSVCEYTATSQSDMNRHLAETHRPVLNEDTSYNQHYNHNNGNSNSNNNNGMNDDFMDNSRRQSSSVMDGYKSHADQEMTSAMNQIYEGEQNGYHNNNNNNNDAMDLQNVVIKKEIVDGSENANQPGIGAHPSTYGFDQHGSYQQSSTQRYAGEWVDMKQAFQKTIMSGLDGNRGNFDKEMFGNWISQQPQIQLPHQQHQSSVLTQNQRCQIFPDEKNLQNIPSTLPGIHEVFSKKNQTTLPSFSHFMPNSTKASIRSSQLPSGQISSQISSQNLQQQDNFSSRPSSKHALPSQSLSSNALMTSSTQPTNSSSGFHQRPTAQLPPITHSSSKLTKDQAVQHSVAISGFPSLDEVLSYYVGQGRLFKCQHCSILFFERGMFFLHSSLHSPTNPWQCSICHKVCSDKNEFTLHFVNQQHNS